MHASTAGGRRRGGARQWLRGGARQWLARGLEVAGTGARRLADRAGPLALGAALALGSLVSATPAQAQQQGATTAELPRQKLDLGDPHQWRYSSITVLRLNPLGFINQSQVGYRYRLFDPEDNSPDAPFGQRLLQNTYVALNFAPSISPAFFRPGVQFEIAPLAILKLNALYEQQAHFGTFRTVQSYRSPNADFSDTTMDETDKAGASYATHGQSLTLGALLQMKVKKVAARTNFRAQWVDMQLRPGDTVFYDIMFDVLQPKTGWMFTTDTDVLVELGSDATMLGVRHTWVSVDYPDDAFLAGEKLDTDNTPTHRVGPIFVHRLNDVTGTAFNQPTIFVMAQWWLAHRYRTGEDVSQAFPYLLAGFGFNGDL